MDPHVAIAPQDDISMDSSSSFYSSSEWRDTQDSSVYYCAPFWKEACPAKRGECVATEDFLFPLFKGGYGFSREGF